MPEKTVKRRLQDCDAALASDDGPIFSTVAKLVDELGSITPLCPKLLALHALLIRTPLREAGNGKNGIPFLSRQPQAFL
jgi:hypothetical protein